MGKSISEMNSVQEVREYLITKAGEDSEFRSGLLSDPKAAISNEFGVTIPDGVNISVHEENLSNVHLVLPLSGELDMELLKEVGGAQGPGTLCSDRCY